MMVKKIVSIKNVGKFVHCIAQPNTDFRKLTLCFADNAMGKTTLSCVLRSLKTGDSIYIIERQSLGISDQPEVTVQLSSSHATFTNGKWNKTVPELEIFDPTFVNENVYSGPWVTHDHKKCLYRFIVGQEGVRLANKVIVLDGKSRSKQKEITEKGDEVGRHVLGGLNVRQFVALQAQDGIGNNIKNKSAEAGALKKAGEVANKPDLAEISLPNSSGAEVKLLLGKSLESVSENAERLTKKHLTECLGENGEAWLSDGVDFMKGELCPFCNQSIGGLDLVTAYKDYFSEAYKALKEEVALQVTEIETSFSEAVLLVIQETIQSNSSLAEYWGEYVTAEWPSVKGKTVQALLSSLRLRLLKVLEKKVAAPLETIELGKALEDRLGLFAKLERIIERYNDLVRTANVQISDKKEKTSLGNLAIAEKQLVLLKNTKARFEGEPKRLADEYAKLVKEKAAIEKEKQQTKDDLDELAQDVLTKYEHGINKYLEDFGADFRICEAGRSYSGGSPSTSYRLCINDTAFDLGDDSTPAGKACFGNTLSSGDKTTLAFAFFLARLDQEDADLENKIIVLDDPITSMDRHRRNRTKQEIARLAKQSCQVIVMSHDSRFLRRLWNDADKGETRSLTISRTGDNSIIREWDIEKETQSAYFKNYLTLQDYLENGAPDDAGRRAVRDRIRPFLEGNLRHRFPGSLPSSAPLGRIIWRVRNADDADELACLKGDLEELKNINEYALTGHHGEEDEKSDPEPVDAPELKAYVTKALEVIGLRPMG